MSDLKLKLVLSGPGGVVDHEVKTIIEALKASGVDIILNHPYYEEPPKGVDRSGITIIFEVHPAPWGG